MESSEELGLDPTELETLPPLKCLPLKGEVWVGEPARPRVVMDSLRCWEAVLALVAAGGLPNGKEAKDARRWWEEGTEIGEVARSLDILRYCSCAGRDQCSVVRDVL